MKIKKIRITLILTGLFILTGCVGGSQSISLNNVGYTDDFKDRIIRCGLTWSQYGFVGSCIAETGTETLESTSDTPSTSRWPDEPVWIAMSSGPQDDPPWRGFMRMDEFVLPFEIAAEVDSVKGSRLVLRNGIAWLIVNEWEEYESGKISLIFGLSKEATATEQDVVILKAAANDLDSIVIWDREDDRNCSNDEADHMSLFCLLYQSVSSQMGHYHHRQPALQLVRKLIRQNFLHRIAGHSIRDFNNNPETTLDDLRHVLEMAITLAQTEAGIELKSDK